MSVGVNRSEATGDWTVFFTVSFSEGQIHRERIMNLVVDRLAENLQAELLRQVRTELEAQLPEISRRVGEEIIKIAMEKAMKSMGT